MSDDMASDWLAVVAADTAHLSDATFLAACRRARRECSFHNQILPTMLKQSDDLAEFVRKMDALATPFLADHRPPPKRQAIEASPAQKLIDAAAKNLKA